jgi:glycosyltransferase involved in cell wall biosynthesis
MKPQIVKENLQMSMPLPVFITARFRTGSTLLWNIFRQVPSVVSYYEPLHEKLPEMIKSQTPPQKTHFNVDTYFKEYPPNEELEQHHTDKFALCRLYLEAQDQYPQLKAYIQYLLDSTEKDKVPVLQFNRIDFRLPWVRNNFPGVPIIHLYRSPRDQWLSSIADHRHSVDVDIDANPYHITTWARDLYQQFPFLASDFITHAYQRYYYLWKLSYLEGVRLADLSISYEELLSSPKAVVGKLLDVASLPVEENLDRCMSVIVQRPKRTWEHYRDEAWFLAMEKECETRLDDLGLKEYFCLKPLADIVTANPTYREYLGDQRPQMWSVYNSQVTINRLENTCNEKEQIIFKLKSVAEERLELINQLSEKIKTARLELGADDYERTKRDDQKQTQINQYLNLHQRALGNAEAAAEARLRVIQEQERALTAYRRWDLREWWRRFIAPRLGVLHQYAPRPMKIPTRYTKSRLLESPPLISIVSPSFNQGDFIERTIKSVLEQNYPELEYIIQDGESSDATREILERYRPSLTYCDISKDKGQTNAINLGFSHATGEIMAYLNTDDILLPGALHYVARFFFNHPNVDVVYGHRVVIDEHDEEIGRWLLPPHDNNVLLWADYIPQETLFWRRRVWEKVGGAVDESFRFAMDWDLLLRFREAGAKFVRLSRFLGAFRVHPHQKTSAQMEQVGNLEMDRLRKRSHGRPVSPNEVHRNLRRYLFRHVVYNKLWRLGVLRD